ncbi:formate/nitrite transporter family protein [Mahella australiensis]|uniref:Formate/nitrite transporter n=1 Tax=Mahella australiensis (strain DSM 15567 / CIP 107919 / 50-1 BON) TaxID=697281 RepID=F4A346_MAHA5|nr:formate/nitrite transporter family protein [Mahella australiensis]AEE96279.1 formate/nitrite transporter [Mahella australiensis 50-1 BON]
MDDNKMNAPDEIAAHVSQTSVQKAERDAIKTFVLAVLAGVFIALAAQASNMAIHTITNYGLSKVVGGAVFSAGLIMVLLAGAELFTGNNLMIIGVLDKRITMGQMLRNWIIVYIGNFVGAVLIALLINHSNLLNSSNGALGGLTVKIAVSKVNLSFEQAFILGILCNWLVCIAVWMSYGAKDAIGKVAVIFFPIWIFVLSGFEHSVANMYYIPAGILAKSDDAFVQASHVSLDMINKLNWGSFIINNLLPVTLGNIVGGSLLVGMIYWFIYSYKRNNGVVKREKARKGMSA